MASMARELTRDHTVLRYDARGSGLSDWDAPEISFEAWLRDLEAVVDAAGLERFPLLGLSQGGRSLSPTLPAIPSGSPTSCSHGAYLRGPARRSGGAAEREEAELLVKLAELGWGKPNPAFRQFFTTQFIPGGTPEQHEWWNELQRRSCSPGNASRYLAAINAIDVTALAPHVTCPTLVLHSTHDARVPFEEGRLAAGLIPGARFVPLESRNHVLLGDERCWPRWLSEVRGFLSSRAGHEGSSPQLSDRERELLELMAQGRDNARIAAALGLSEKTVRNYITSVFAKLEVESRAQASFSLERPGSARPPASLGAYVPTPGPRHPPSATASGQQSLPASWGQANNGGHGNQHCSPQAERVEPARRRPSGHREPVRCLCGPGLGSPALVRKLHRWPSAAR